MSNYTDNFTAYEEGYQKGREDYEIECQKRYCAYTGKDCIIGNLVEEDIYQQGRIDAIDELMNEMRNISYNIQDADALFDEVLNIANQIKENNNE